MSETQFLLRQEAGSRDTIDNNGGPTLTINQYRQALTRLPFRPFRAVLADERPYTIQHPEFAAMDPRGREVTFCEEEGTQHFIESMLIAEVLVPPMPESSDTRWPSERRKLPSEGRRTQRKH